MTKEAYVCPHGCGTFLATERKRAGFYRPRCPHCNTAGLFVSASYETAEGAQAAGNAKRREMFVRDLDEVYRGFSAGGVKCIEYIPKTANQSERARIIYEYGDDGEYAAVRDIDIEEKSLAYIGMEIAAEIAGARG